MISSRLESIWWTTRKIQCRTNDTLDKLETIQFHNIPSSVDDKKLKWYGDVKGLNMKGKWLSPGGFLRLFNEGSEGIVIRFYSDTASLLFQGPDGKQICDVLID